MPPRTWSPSPRTPSSTPRTRRSSSPAPPHRHAGDDLERGRSSGHAPGDPARITWTGTGTTGAPVQIHTEGDLSVLPGYKLTFTYTLIGEPTTIDSTINVTP